MNPLLPLELEREIFETTAIFYPRHIPALLRVAKRVNLWLKPLLFRVVRFSDEAHSEALHRAMKSEPDLLRIGLKYLNLDDVQYSGWLSDEVDALLALSTSIIDIAVSHEHPTTHTYPVVPVQLQPRRFMGVIKSLLGVEPPAMSTAVFLSLTHIELNESILNEPQTGHDDKRPAIISALLAAAPNLTHLSSPQPMASLSWPAVQNVLEAMPKLKMLVALYSAYNGRVSASELEEVNAGTIRDVRFMAGTFPDDGDSYLDWEQSATCAAKDYWARGEIFLERKKRGQVAVTRYWIDDAIWALSIALRGSLA
ncbi:hypothetical protein HMN09_00987000 [Mycena chlorophos]|uniref:Uncharacterized protein n=1 Tax=Mycena chlorophos TaxID=658473 RepID=A0A8H6W1R8_MYCCL|nr:hypothetical protein HMN09_00987000 [Mycena chlorophos]